MDVAISTSTVLKIVSRRDYNIYRSPWMTFPPEQTITRLLTEWTTLGESQIEDLMTWPETMEKTARSNKKGR